MLDLTIYQYNAYCEGYKLRQVDELASRVEAAYYGAYWNGASKHKKSLQSVVNKLYQSVRKSKKKTTEPIDIKALDKEFAEMEVLRNYARSEK